MKSKHEIGVARVAVSAAILLATASAAQAEVRFLDHRDKVIVRESPPQRLVSLFASGPIVYDAVDGSLDHIVGVNRQGLAMYQDSIYAQVVPGLLKARPLPSRPSSNDKRRAATDEEDRLPDLGCRQPDHQLPGFRRAARRHDPSARAGSP